MYLKSEELCKAIRQGKDVTENLAQIEPQLKHYYKERRKALQENRFQCANDSILHACDALYDVSASVRRHWDRPCRRADGRPYPVLYPDRF